MTKTGLDKLRTERNLSRKYECEFKNSRGGIVKVDFYAASEDEAYEKIKAHAKKSRLRIHIWRLSDTY